MKVVTVGRDPASGEGRRTLASGHRPTAALLPPHGEQGAASWSSRRTRTSGRRAAAGLDPYKAKIDALMAKYPELSAVRVLEEIRKGPDGYRVRSRVVRQYLRQIRPRRRRVYQEVFYEPGQAMQVDWGSCGQIRIGSTQRQVSVFVAVLCYSRLCYIEFSLSQRKAEFYRRLVHALEFFGGSPRQIIFDNLKAAVLNGSGRQACLHPEFLALCGHFCLEPIACARRDPESKGIVEASVRYVKRNALAGPRRRTDLLGRLRPAWPSPGVTRSPTCGCITRPGSVRSIASQQERCLLRPLPALPFDTDEVVSAIVSSHARVHFDGNRYSVPPQAAARKTVLVRASDTQVRVLAQGEEVARHVRCYDRGQLICQPEHQLEALKLRSRVRAARHRRHLRCAGDGSPPVPPGAAPPAGEDHRPSAAAAESGASLWPTGRAWPPSAAPTTMADLRRGLCGDHPAAGATTARTAVAHAGASPASRN